MGQFAALARSSLALTGNPLQLANILLVTSVIGNLTALTDLRVDACGFSGVIPAYIGKPPRPDVSGPQQEQGARGCPSVVSPALHLGAWAVHVYFAMLPPCRDGGTAVDTAMASGVPVGLVAVRL